MSDFIIITSDNEKVPCHRNVLAAIPRFAHPTEERRLGKVELKDLKKEICDTILKFSYTGCLDDDDITMQLF